MAEDFEWLNGALKDGLYIVVWVKCSNEPWEMSRSLGGENFVYFHLYQFILPSWVHTLVGLLHLLKI